MENKIYLCSDIHGQGQIFDQVITYLNEQENYHLYFLGDACDRGPAGIYIMNKLLTNPNVTYLKGNHEDMFISAARALKNLAAEDNFDLYNITEEMLTQYAHWDSDIGLHIYNGGIPTLLAWCRDGADMHFINMINKLPICYSTIINNIIYDMCHSGCERKDWGYSPTGPDAERIYLWTRLHYIEDWFDGHILIHGHTPMNYFKKRPWYKGNYPTLYANGTKMDIDTGIYSKDSDTFYLIELPSMKLIPFKKD